MPDAAKTLASLRRILEHRDHWLDADEAKAVQDAITLVERATPKPTTLDWAVKVLNERKWLKADDWQVCEYEDYTTVECSKYSLIPSEAIDVAEKLACELPKTRA